MVLWDAACNFNAVILNQSIFNCLITSASTLRVELILFYAVPVLAFFVYFTCDGFMNGHCDLFIVYGRGW